MSRKKTDCRPQNHDDEQLFLGVGQTIYIKSNVEYLTTLCLESQLFKAKIVLFQICLERRHCGVKSIFVILNIPTKFTNRIKQIC